MSKLYVGNLPFTTTEDETKNLFAEYGSVQEVAMIQDRETQKFRGFCFVTYGDKETAMIAKENLDGVEFNGRKLRVHEAISKPRGGNRR